MGWGLIGIRHLDWEAVLVPTDQFDYFGLIAVIARCQPVPGDKLKELSLPEKYFR